MSYLGTSFLINEIVQTFGLYVYCFNQAFIQLTEYLRKLVKDTPFGPVHSGTVCKTPAKYIIVIGTAMFTACGGVENFLRIIF